MPPKIKPVFAAERSRIRNRHADATIGDVLDGMASLETSVREEIQDQIGRICEKLDGAADTGEQAPADQVIAEIHAMNEQIHQTKQEIAGLKSVDGDNSSLSLATEELGEVVKATEEAANSIMENAEKIDAIVAGIKSRLPDEDADGIESDVDRLEFISMELITACGFQDITGQRINKVVNTLSYIEGRLQKLIEIWGIEQGEADVHEITFAKDDARTEKELIHGPQSAGMDQSDIDALFD